MITLPVLAAAPDSPNTFPGTRLGSTNTDVIWVHPWGFEGLAPDGDTDCFYAWITSSHFKLTVIAYSYPGAATETDVAIFVARRSGYNLEVLAEIDAHAAGGAEYYSATFHYKTGEYYFGFKEGWRDTSGSFYTFRIIVDHLYT